MINEYNTKKFCKEDISKIENYDKAVNDTTQTWHCHHRDEVRTLPSGMTVIRSKQDLIENDRYYNCPANELIFLTKSEHNTIHFKGIKLSKEHTKKMSEAHKGIKLSDETRRKLSEAHKGKKGKTSSRIGKFNSIFGKAFYEHYGIYYIDDIKLYRKEYNLYKRHSKFSWEVSNA